MTTSPPYEIRLVVEPDPAAPADPPAYLAHWQNDAGQPVTPPFPLQPPLAPADLAELRWYLEEFLTFPQVGERKRAAALEPKLRAWGQALFAAAFGSEQARQVLAHMQQAETQGRLCRITIGCDQPLVLQQPWELLADRRGPLAFRGITMRRQLPESQDALLPLFTPPLRVLLIVSRPEDVGFLDPRNSIRPLLEAVSALPPGMVQLDLCEPPTFGRLEELVGQARRARRPYHIVHFDGHGTYLPHTGVGALVFENERAERALVSGRQLGDLLSRLQVPLVLLEACRSADLAAQPPHESVAPALLQAGVGSVVAFSHSVHVAAAQLLVERFYGELAAGRTIGQALDEARVRLHAVPARWLGRGPDAATVDLQDWFIPQLYQVGPDPALLAGVAAPTADAPALVPLDEARLHGFPPPPRYSFQGRAQELLRLERDFRAAPAVLLTGMGGMGKTALAREAAAWWLRTGRIEEAVFVSLEGRPPAERVVQLIGLALEGDGFSARPAEEQWQRVVAAFRARRLLVVWDNAESVLPQFQSGLEAEILRYSADDLALLRRLYTDLTAHGPKGRLLITCRPATLDWAQLKARPLRGLARADSQYVLRAVLERHAEGRPPQHDRAELDALLDLLDDHPLSLELVGPHLLRRRPQDIRAEFRELLEQFKSDAPDEARNRSLRASLAFSLRHLSEGARALLPWLAWFSGGVFEDDVQRLAEITPETWEPLLAELVGTALVRVEEVPGFKPRYLHLHPTLPYAASPEQVPDADKAEGRFIAVYLGVRNEADKALHGQHPAFGMALVRLEEANCRMALARAFHRSDQRSGAILANTLREFLERAGQLRERDTLVQWVRTHMSNNIGLDEATCTNVLAHSWTLFTQGQETQAVEILRGLLVRLEQEGLTDGRDPSEMRAHTLLHLGRVYNHSGRPSLALPPLQQAVTVFEQLGEPQQDNLAATLGSLANAHCDLGQFATGLRLAENGLRIHRRLGQPREIAVDLGRIAHNLLQQHRYSEADARYREALEAARQAGDYGLEGLLLQHRGGAQSAMGNYDQAVQLYQEAMRRFQQAGNLRSEMQTSDLLASAEMQRDNLDTAQAWYQRARELAIQLNDRRQLGGTTQNLSVLYQTLAERERDPAQRVTLLKHSLNLVQESLLIKQEQHDNVGIAFSFLQIGILYRLMIDLPRAEQQLEQARSIFETLEHPNVSMAYKELAQLAHARGDTVAAVQWQVKYESKESELVRRRGTGGQMPPLVRFEPLLRAIAAVALGDDSQRAELEQRLAELQAKGWMLIDPVHRIWAGERDLAALAAGLDVQDTALVARILQFVADPAAPPLLPEEEPPPAPQDALAALPPSIRAAVEQGDQAALQRAYEALPEDEQRAVAAALQALSGQQGDAPPDDPIARGLQQAEPLLQAVAQVARGDSSQRIELEEALAQMEQRGFMLLSPARRIWAGERDAAALTAGLDPTDTALVRRVLELLAS